MAYEYLISFRNKYVSYITFLTAITSVLNIWNIKFKIWRMLYSKMAHAWHIKMFLQHFPQCLSVSVQFTANINDFIFVANLLISTCGTQKISWCASAIHFNESAWPIWARPRTSTFTVPQASGVDTFSTIKPAKRSLCHGN